MASWKDPDLEFRFEGRTVRHGVIGEGPPLVLLHGTPFSSRVWRRIAPHLAGQRRVHFHDMPGYGVSEKAEGQDVSLAVQGRVLAALLEHWGLERPDVVAHDFGGATALRAHLLHGCEFRSLTLVDAVAIRPWGSPFVQHVRRHEAAFALMPDYAHRALLEAYLATAAHRPLDPEALRLHAEPWLGPAGQPAFYRQIAQMDERLTDEVEARLGALRCPAQVLWGEQDAWLPPEQGRRLAALAGAPFRPVPGSGHLMQEDAPEAILAAVLDFLPDPARRRP